MAKRVRKNFLVQAFQRQLSAMTRITIREGAKVLKRSIRSTTKQLKTTVPAKGNLHASIAFAAAGARRYYVYKPPGVKRTEKLPLVVMLHGCGQDAKGFAASTQMNQVAARERFIVLYPEQDRVANAQGCWNWYGTDTGRAQGEAAIILAAIDQVCLFHPVDDGRIAIAGLSAGASMAALIASRYPGRFEAVAMHSGIGTGLAHSSASVLGAMRGRGTGPAHAPAKSAVLPALLVIQGNKDHVVAPVNGAQAVIRWAAVSGARAGHARAVQRGSRYRSTVVDWCADKRIVATLCEVDGLGHAWSGGAMAHAFSDPKGPDAARMIWSFAAKQFALAENRVAQMNQ